MASKVHQRRSNGRSTLTAIGLLVMGALLPNPSVLAQKPKMSEEEMKEFLRGFKEGMKEALEQANVIKRHQQAGTDARNRGAYGEAEVEYRKALKLATETKGPDSPEAHLSRWLLTDVLYQLGKDAEFADLMEEVTHYWKKNPEVHSFQRRVLLPLTLKYCVDLQLPKERHVEFLGRILADSRSLGNGCESATLRACAQFYAKTGDYERAVKTIRLAVSKAEKGGVINVSSAGLRNDLALSLIQNGQPNEAEQEVNTTLQWFAEIFGQEHAFAKAARGRRGIVLARNGKFAEALPDLEIDKASAQAMHIVDGSIQMADARYTHAVVLRELGRHEDASVNFAEAERIFNNFKTRKPYEAVELGKKLKEWPLQSKPAGK